MKLVAALLVGLAMIVGFTGTTVDAGDKDKEVTIKGSITCAKCDLKLEKKCATVIVEKKDGKDVVYYFDKASNKKYHADICTEAKDGTVTGTVKKEGKKHMISITKLEYKK